LKNEKLEKIRKKIENKNDHNEDVDYLFNYIMSLKSEIVRLNAKLAMSYKSCQLHATTAAGLAKKISDLIKTKGE